MRLVINLGQMLKIQMGVNLRGRQVGVTEEFLDGAQVAGGFEDVGGEGVAELVGVDALVQTLTFGPVGHAFLNGAHGQRLAGEAGENARFRAVAERLLNPAPALQGGQRMAADWHQTFALTLAQHANHAVDKIQLWPAQSGQLADPQAGGIEQFQHGAIAGADVGLVRNVEQGQYLIDIEDFRETTANLRCTYALGRVMLQAALFAQVSKQPAHGRQAALNAAWAQAPTVLAGGKGADVVRVDVSDPCPLVAPGPVLEAIQVAAVGIEGGRAQAGPELREESLDGTVEVAKSEVFRRACDRLAPPG